MIRRDLLKLLQDLLRRGVDHALLVHIHGHDLPVLNNSCISLRSNAHAAPGAIFSHS